MFCRGVHGTLTGAHDDQGAKSGLLAAGLIAFDVIP